MAVKIEWILICLILAILTFAYDFKVKNQDIHKSVKKSKNLEFYDISFSKVDTKRLISIVNAKYGVVSGNVLNAYSVVYKDTQIDKLMAKHAIFVDDYLYLEENVSVYKKDGFSCFTQKAIYDKRLSILSVPEKFIAKLNGNTLKGDSFEYYLKSKLLKASKIEASLEL